MKKHPADLTDAEEDLYFNWLFDHNGSDTEDRLKAEGYKWIYIALNGAPKIDQAHVIVTGELEQGADLVFSKKLLLKYVGPSFKPITIGTRNEAITQEILDFYEEHGGDIVLTQPTMGGEMFAALVHPATREGVAWQGSKFDKLGPFGHVEAQSMEDAIRRLVEDGFRTPDPQGMAKVLGARANPAGGLRLRRIAPGSYELASDPAWIIQKVIYPTGQVAWYYRNLDPDHPFYDAHDHFPTLRVARRALAETLQEARANPADLVDDVERFLYGEKREMIDPSGLRGDLEGDEYLLSDYYQHPERFSKEDERAVGRILGEARARRRKNPPYSGYDARYPYRKMPKNEDRISYPRKRDALNVFLLHNSDVVDRVFHGPGYTGHGPEAFENINLAFDLKGKRRVDNLAKAAWWAFEPARSSGGAPPWYIEDIDIDLLNNTDRMQRAWESGEYRGEGFTMPDQIRQAQLAEEEAEYYAGLYEGDDSGEVVPF